MSINYNDYLTAEQKKAINEQRLVQLAAEAYQNDVAAKAAEAAGDATSAAQFIQNIETIVSVMETHQAEIDALGE